MNSYSKEYAAQKAREWRARNPYKVKLRNKKNEAKIPTCHPERKHKGRGLCVICYRKKQEQNPEYMEKRRAYDRARYYRTRTTPEYRLKVRNRTLKATYGIDLITYNEMFKLQGGKCKICLKERFTKKNKHFHVDHCHKTGKVRGLLCYKCNWYLAEIDENPSILHHLIKYKGINV